MSSRALPVLIAVVLLVLVATLTSLFTVSETELAVRTQFGAIMGSNYTPGLHWKLPWDQVSKFDKRILTQSYQGETFLTNDNRGLIVDFYIKWRVANAARYYQATGGREEIAGERLAEIVKDGIKSVMAQRTLFQIVSAERAAVTGEMLGGASQSAAALGAEVVDVRVQRIDLPDDVATRVFENMKQNFAKIASRLRAEGQSSALGIRASAERQRTEIIANAQREALRIEGAGDAQAADIYAKAYGSNAELYAFWRSLQAYANSIGKEGDMLVLAPDSDFFKYFKDPGRGVRR
jgi:membrane protease subunit HflC